MKSGTPVDREPGPGLDISVRARGDVIVVRLVGDLGAASAPVLREQLLGLLRPGSSRLVVDMSAVTFCDVGGLAVLVGAGRVARLLGGFLHLAAISPLVLKSLRIAGLQGNMPMFPSVQAAAIVLRHGQEVKAAATGTPQLAGTAAGPGLAGGTHPLP
jgi:anti-anti-sigma factor